MEHAFHTAWENWPEVAKDHDPKGWLRAAAHEYALSPWHRLRPRGRGRPDHTPPQGDEQDRALFHALLALPPAYRRAVMVYDGAGLDLPEAAAELEASTPAAAGRITHAREALATAVPELHDLDPTRQGELLHERLRRLSAAQITRVLPPGAARHRSEKRTSSRTRRAATLTAAIAIGVVITTLTERDYTIDRTLEHPPWEQRQTAPVQPSS
ncbi:sigma factor-like helix-turn-helix DNA-binding protein [Streptomyces sp. NPDC051940]|uniref:RNA polymerase sigma factor n=1 Tax=Streptomyces sp. NPDC051940 TaxID=3155675 RepID=UPI00341F7862